METYVDRYHNLGIRAFEIGASHIDVQFEDGSIYRYDGDRPGSAHVAQMIVLARSGGGLNTYIRRCVGKNFSLKLR